MTEQEARAAVENACQRADVTLREWMFYPIVPTADLPIDGSVFCLRAGLQVIVYRVQVEGEPVPSPANAMQYAQNTPPSEVERAAYDYALFCKERAQELLA